MGVLKNDVGRPSNKTIRTRFALKLTLVFIVSFVAGYLLSIYVVPDKESKDYVNHERTCNATKGDCNEKNQTDEETDNNNKNESLEKEEISKNSAEQIMNRIFGEYYSTYIHYNGLVFNDDGYKTYMAIVGSEKNGSSCKDIYGNNVTEDGFLYKGDMPYVCHNEVYDYNVVEKTYKSYFGNKYSPLKKSSNETYGLASRYDYIEDKSMYSIYNVITGDAYVNPTSDIIEAYKNGDKVYIRVIYTTIMADENIEGMYYLTLTDGTTVTLTNDELVNKSKINEYKDKINQCEFIFFEEDGVYKFEKVIKK